MFKRILSFILILITLQSFVMISTSAESNVNEEIKIGYCDFKGFETADNIDVKTYIKNQLLNFKTSISIEKYDISTQDIKSVYLSVLFTNPEIFQVATSFSYTYSDKNVITVKPSYLCDVNKYKTFKNNFEQKTNEILSEITSDMSDYDKALVLHDKIINNCKYNKNNSKEYAYTAYGPLVLGEAVCQGYSLAYKYLLNKVGITAYICSSSAMNHAWNIIKVDNSYYHVDLTWDDALTSSEYYDNGIDILGSTKHQYFLLSDLKINKLKHYAWSPCGPDIKCNSIKYDETFEKNIGSNIYKVNKYYYFIDNNVLYKFDGTNKTTVLTIPVFSYNNHINYFAKLDKMDNYLYYNANNSIYKYNIEKNKSNIYYTVDNVKSSEAIIGFNLDSNNLNYQIINKENGLYSEYTVNNLKESNDESSALISINKPKIKNIKNTNKGIYLKWSKVNNTDGYKIYRKTKTGQYKLIKTLNKNKVSFTDATAKNGVKYYYYIKAYKNYATLKSNAKSITRITAITLKSVKYNKSKKQVTIKWTKNSKASGYYLYRKINNDK